MSQKQSRFTVYAEFVYSNLTARIAEGQGAYTVLECAEMVGLKPTQHFKKRVRQMAKEGLLTATPVFTPRGGLTVVYSLPEGQLPKDYPF